MVPDIESRILASFRFYPIKIFFQRYGDHRVLHSFPTTTLFRSVHHVRGSHQVGARAGLGERRPRGLRRSEEHTSELQSPYDLVCRLLLEKKTRLAIKRNSVAKADGRHLSLQGLLYGHTNSRLDD